MLRVSGNLPPGLIVGGVAVPWVSGPQLGTWSSLDVLIGLMGYFSTSMGILLGATPIAVAGFMVFLVNPLNQTAPSAFYVVSNFSQLIKPTQVAVGQGPAFYFGAADLMLFTAFFASRRRSIPA